MTTAAWGAQQIEDGYFVTLERVTVRKSVASAAGTDVPIVWRGRRVSAFVPTPLAARDLALQPATIALASAAQAAIEHAAETLPADYIPLARLLLRAEGVASSFIEGVAAPVVDVVLAETAARGEPTPATWVAANLDAVVEAIASAKTGPLEVEDICEWHRTLMKGSPTPARHVGKLRTEQGWIGGTSPLDAHLVTPPPEHVPHLVDDLVDFANRSDIDAVAQAAIAHAQFEVIHPFADGNGRIGRVLIAWILVRRLALLTPPPVSTTIAGDIGGYAAGLVQFRLGDHDAWVRWLANAVAGAGRAQRDLVAAVEQLQAGWVARLDRPRRGGRRLRSDAAAWRVLELIPSHLVFTSGLVEKRLGVPRKTANAALRALADADILVEHGFLPPARGRPGRLYTCPSLLGLSAASPLR